jgi:inorganic pyrophosphatase
MKLPSAFIRNTENIYVIIEACKGSGSKYIYDAGLDMFRLKKILPRGTVFPYHFGFIPHTKGADGDPLDVLVLMDGSSYPGCLIECKVLGVIAAEQTAGNKRIRNDRFIAVPLASENAEALDDLGNVHKYVLKEIVNFLLAYTALTNKDLAHLGNRGRKAALELIKKQKDDEHN